MTASLRRSFVAAILAAALSSLTLAALVTHAALNRPEPFTLSIPMDCFTFRGEAASCRPHLDTPTPEERTPCSLNSHS